MAGSMISFKTSSAPFSKTEAKLRRLIDGKMFASLDQYGAEGAAALAGVTPVETGESAAAWSYEVISESGVYGIRWINTHLAGSTPLVILLQYGHGTGTGGYVQGRDFINPVIKPLFERIKADVRKAVSTA